MPVLHIVLDANGVGDIGSKITIPQAIKPQKVILRNYVVKLNSTAVGTATNSLFYVDIDWLSGSLSSNKNNNHHLALNVDYSKAMTNQFVNYTFHPPEIKRAFMVKVSDANGGSPNFGTILEEIHLFFDYFNTTHSTN